jgi:hypothetical protein
MWRVRFRRNSDTRAPPHRRSALGVLSSRLGGSGQKGDFAPIPVIRRIEAYAVVSIYQLAQLQRPQQIRRVS